MKKHLLLVLTFTQLALGAARAADAPQSVNYQGKLLNAAGANVSDGTYTIQFKIYGAATGSTLLWGASSSVVVSSGLFNIIMGQGFGTPIAGATYTAIADALSFTTTPYLGLTITVDSSGPVPNPQEISPRLLFLSSPYALVAHAAHLADSATTATNALQLGGLSASAYFTPASSAATTLQGPVTLANTAIANGTFTANGATRLAGAVQLDGPLTIGASGTTVGGGFVPVGGIIMWSGATVPAGWGLCDGTQSTPDLRNRFIVGSGSSYANGAQGGATTATLTASMIPDHKHQFKDTVWSESNICGGTLNNGPEGLGVGCDTLGNSIGSTSGYDQNNNLSWVWRTTLYARSINYSPATANDSVPTVPPYYALAFIKRLQ